jgi:hypothetical protein
MKSNYGTEFYNKIVNGATVQILDAEQRWDLDSLHVTIHAIPAGQTLTIGYGPNADSPMVAQFKEVFDADFRLPSAGVSNPDQLPLNAVVSGGSTTFADIEVGVHRVKNDNLVWLKQTSPAFGARDSAGLTVFDGKLFVAGGFGATDLDDVWNTSDGITWTQNTVSGAWGGRGALGFLNFAGKLWVIGGYDSNNNVYYNDVWSSPDGDTWTQETGLAAFSARGWFGCCVAFGKMWIIGGWDGSDSLNDVWSSEDGVTWTQVKASAEFEGRDSFNADYFQGKIFIGGGENTAGDVLPNVWSSKDGEQWVEAIPESDSAKVQGYASAVFNQNRNGQLFYMGGYNGANTVNDIVKTADGGNWSNEATPAWTARTGAVATVFKGSIYLVGGDASGRVNDVYRTAVPVI